MGGECDKKISHIILVHNDHAKTSQLQHHTHNILTINEKAQLL